MEFRYVARDNKGNIVEGFVTADTEFEASNQLRQKNLTPIVLQPVKQTDISKYLPFLKLFGGVKAKDVVVFMRQLAVMVNAGISIPVAIESIAQQVTNKRFKSVLIDVKSRVEQGVNLSDALRRHPDVFDRLLVAMVEAGERTGELETMLNRWTAYAEKIIALKSKVRNAMIYPAFVLLFAFGVLFFLLYKVVPMFIEIFEAANVPLPMLTVIVMKMSKFIQSKAYLIFLFIVMVVVIFRILLKNENFAYWWDSFMLGIPLIGGILRKVAIARFARTLATMHASGVSVIEALEIVAKTTGNRVFEKTFMDIRNEVVKGGFISDAMRKSGMFLPMVVEMIASGEKTGRLSDLLDKVADFYEEEVDSAVSVLTSLMEPIMIIFVGGIVGTIVVALYLPIFKLGQTIK